MGRLAVFACIVKASKVMTKMVIFKATDKFVFVFIS